MEIINPNANNEGISCCCATAAMAPVHKYEGSCVRNFVCDAFISEICDGLLS